MAAFEKLTVFGPLLNPGASASQSENLSQRKSSTTSTHSIPSIPSGHSPKVQLVPYARTASFGVSFDAEPDLLKESHFDAFDLSSEDFDFEDIFTYNNPQKKLSKVVEVSTPAREPDWSNFSFSHYTAAMGARSKMDRPNTGIRKQYLKNQSETRKQQEHGTRIGKL
jgi:hypothetical protein